MNREHSKIIKIVGWSCAVVRPNKKKHHKILQTVTQNDALICRSYYEIQSHYI